MKVWLKTHVQIKDLMERNKALGKINTAVIPLGSTEQHGNNLPLGTDTFLAVAAAKWFDERCEDRLFVYPPIEYTNADSGMGFAGTVSVGHNCVRLLLEDLLRSLVRQKYDAVLFIDAHAINRADLYETGFRLVDGSFQEDRPFPVVLVCLYDYYSRIASSHGFEIGSHADWFELALFRSAGGVVENAGLESENLAGIGSPCFSNIPGVPIEFRSCGGSIGPVRPPKNLPAEVIDGLWNELLIGCFDDFQSSLDCFRNRFKPTRNV